MGKWEKGRSKNELAPQQVRGWLYNCYAIQVMTLEEMVSVASRIPSLQKIFFANDKGVTTPRQPFGVSLKRRLSAKQK